MVKWIEKDIVDLSNEELIDAYSKLLTMLQNYENAKLDPRFTKKFQNQVLPIPNPIFTELRDAVAYELNKREIIP